MHEMYFLLRSYKEQLKELKVYRESLERQPKKETCLSEGTHHRVTELPNGKSEHEIVGGMVSDLEYAIEWIETGRKPGAKRDIDQRSVYELTYYIDPVVLENYARYEEPEETEDNEVSEWDRLRIEDALSVLTEAEKEVFMMHHVERFSLDQIAVLRNVKKTSIQNQLERAKKKITEQKSCSLFAFAV